MELTTLIEELKIPVEFGCRLEEVTDGKVVCRDTKSSKAVEFPADTVLLAAGMTPRSEAADSLRRCVPETEVFVVGDAAEVGTIAGAVRSAFRAAAYI